MARDYFVANRCLIDSFGAGGACDAPTIATCRGSELS